MRPGHCSIRHVEHIVKHRLLPAFGVLRLDRVGRPAIEHWFDAMSRDTPGAANIVLALLRHIVTVAVAASHVPHDPGGSIRPNPGRKMTRFLSAEKIARLHRTLTGSWKSGPRAGRRPTSSACC